MKDEMLNICSNVSLYEIIDCLIGQLTHEELITFVVSLDEQMQDWDFTLSLVDHFKKLGEKYNLEEDQVCFTMSDVFSCDVLFPSDKGMRIKDGSEVSFEGRLFSRNGHFELQVEGSRVSSEEEKFWESISFSPYYSRCHEERKISSDAGVDSYLSSRVVLCDGYKYLRFRVVPVGDIGEDDIFTLSVRGCG